METKEEGVLDFLLGYRKTIAWFSLFIVSIILRLKGYVDGAQLVDLLKATFLGFITGNISEHLGNLGQTYFNSKALPAIKEVISKEEG